MNTIVIGSESCFLSAPSNLVFSNYLIVDRSVKTKEANKAIDKEDLTITILMLLIMASSSSDLLEYRRSK